MGTVLMFLGTNRAFLDFEVGPLVGRVDLTADFITKTNGSKNTHGTDWELELQSV